MVMGPEETYGLDSAIVVVEREPKIGVEPSAVIETITRNRKLAVGKSSSKVSCLRSAGVGQRRRKSGESGGGNEVAVFVPISRWDPLFVTGGVSFSRWDPLFVTGGTGYDSYRTCSRYGKVKDQGALHGVFKYSAGRYTVVRFGAE
ncbi:Hypothetical predicted protein, partial [Olea europaea subsp. europaea]